MARDRIQRQIDSLLDEADQALAHGDWLTVASRARAVLRLDSENSDAHSYLRVSLSKMAPGYIKPETVREVERVRERAWRDAFLTTRGMV